MHDSRVRGYMVGGHTDPHNVLGTRLTETIPAALGAGSLSSATSSQLDRGTQRPWHPDSPLFWFGVLAATTFGLIGATTTVRLGPFRASASAGGN